MSYFRKTKNEAGEETFEEVDLSKEELPEAVVKAQKPFQDVLTESIQRRQEIANLKAKKPATSEDSDGEPVKTPIKPEPPVQTPAVDPDVLFTEFEKRLAAKQTAVEVARQAEEVNLTTIIKEVGLRDDQDVRQILADAKNPRALAEKLVKSTYRFDAQTGGDPAKKEVDDAIGGGF